MEEKQQYKTPLIFGHLIAGNPSGVNISRDVVAPAWMKWYEIKAELIGMWELVNEVRKLSPVGV